MRSAGISSTSPSSADTATTSTAPDRFRIAYGTMKSVVSVPALSATIATSGRMRAAFGMPIVSLRAAFGTPSAIARVGHPHVHTLSSPHTSNTALPAFHSRIVHPRQSIACPENYKDHARGHKDNSTALSAMSQSTCSARNVVVVGFEGVQSLDITGPMEVFAVANRHLPDHAVPYRLTLASQHGDDIVTHAGLRLAGAAALAALPGRIDTLIVAGGHEAALRHAASEAGVLPWLRTRIADTRRIASICTGAFVLAAGGWLDGKRATTHWNQCSALQALCPGARIDPDAIYVSDPPFHTSAGVTAGIDLCLALVEADCGAPTALAVARELVLFMHRPGGQAQFSVGLDIQARATPRMRSLLADIADDPAGDLGVAALAARMHMSERTFARNFLKETGVSPAQYVLAARIERAKALLERADWPLERIAERSGFGSVDALQRAFAKRVGTSPRDYRARFGPRRDKPRTE